MKILALEPYYGGSHKQFLDGLIDHSAHEIIPLTMPARYWKWRNCASGFQFSQQLDACHKDCDIIFASDFTNLADFVALNRSWLQNKPLVLYMHENQLTYPAHQQGDLDWAYPLLNISSCLVADKVVFNSEYHRTSFFEALPAFVKACPDLRPSYLREQLQAKSSVLPLGLDFSGINAKAKKQQGLILWNHRWEHDKGPELLFEVLFELAEEGMPFKLAVTGISYNRLPPVFERAEKLLKNNIVQWGFMESRTEYMDLLSAADIIVSTARHDFFGISIAEGLAAGAEPVLPHMLNYPSLLPEEYHTLLYPQDGLKQRLLQALTTPLVQKSRNDIVEFVRKFSWERMGPVYDDFFSLIG